MTKPPRRILKSLSYWFINIISHNYAKILLSIGRKYTPPNHLFRLHQSRLPEGVLHQSFIVTTGISLISDQISSGHGSQELVKSHRY